MPAKSKPARRASPARNSVRRGFIGFGELAAIMAILAAIISGLYGYWNTQRSAEDAKAEIIKVRADFAVEIAARKSETHDVAERVNGIDKAGTDYGRSAYSSVSVERQQVRKDVDEMQQTLRVLVPSVTEINANVKWLMNASGVGGGQNQTTAPLTSTRPRSRQLSRR